MVKSSLKVLVGLVASASAQDIGYNNLYETAPDEFEQKCVKVSRTLPTWAEGDYVIPSAGKFELGTGKEERHFVGFVDAFGKLHKFDMKGDQVCATYKLMRTGFYNESMKEGTIGKGFLFHETEPPRKCPMGISLACKLENLGAANDNTFVNTVKLGKHLVTLTDSPFGIEIEPETMDVIGKFAWDDNLTPTNKGVIPYSGSAHPLRHPTTGKTMDFVGTENMMNGQAIMKIFEIDDAQPKVRNSVVDVPDGTPPYMHSFGATDKYVVLPHMPVKFDLSATIMKASMADAFVELHPKGPSADNAFHIMPLVADKDTKPIVKMLPESDRLYYTHTVNTYENASGIVIDLATTATNPFVGNLTVAHQQDKHARDTDSAHVMVRRFLVPLDESTPITSEPLSDPSQSTDFTNINPRYAGKKHCSFWGTEWWSDHKSYASMSIVKHEICGERKARYWHRANWYPSEPVFIASTAADAAEDDGLLIFTALDGVNKQSYLMLVDPKTMETVTEAGPFPPIGFTLHGQFHQAQMHLSSQHAKNIYV